MMLQPRFQLLHIAKRWKASNSKAFYPNQLKKKSNREKALTHFDDFYQSVYGERWPGIRASLLTEHKYIALVNNFGDSNETKEMLESNGAVNVRLIYERFIEESIKNESTNSKAGHKKNNKSVDERVTGILEKTQATEFQSLYQQNSEAKLEALKLESDASRVIETPAETVNLSKSLEKGLEEDYDVDYNRLVSAEIGAIGLQEFIPATRLKGMEDFVRESDHYSYYSTTVDFPLAIEPETAFKFPEMLDFYVYPEGDISRFQRPRRGTTEVSSHFLVDGASILPPLMLNVQLGDNVLDACAAPGGKSLVLLQTALPDIVVSNDVSESRTKRIRSLFRQYLMDFETKWLNQRCLIEKSDIRQRTEFSTYDKILVDVPCTNDRHSVMEDDNNIFRSTRIKERLRLPELQAEILVQCLQLLKPGGSLVYSTCSLSPVQNDGVVHMALSKAFTEFHITATVKDLTHVVRPLKNIFRFENSNDLKYGQLVLPYLPMNFGPMYFCKMTRNGNEVERN